MPRKILVNRCYGGFSLSKEARRLYKEAMPDDRENKQEILTGLIDIPRDDPILIRIVEEIGLPQASGEYASLAIVEIPDDVPDDGWEINEYDGVEWVAEKHRKWVP